MNDIEKDYAKYFTKEAFWEKLQLEARFAGPALCRKALTLFYVLEDVCPEAVQNSIIGALGYFIAEEDIIPDFVPAVGYNDDMDVIMEVERKVSAYITEKAKDKAAEALIKFFPNK